MGLVESANPEVRTLKGLHLCHLALSNCSQRVRMALDNQHWLSWINLRKKREGAIRVGPMRKPRVQAW